MRSHCGPDPRIAISNARIVRNARKGRHATRKKRNIPSYRHLYSAGDGGDDIGQHGRGRVPHINESHVWPEPRGAVPDGIRRPLTQAQRLELPVLREQFDSNAAVQAYNRAGQQLKNSDQLASAISAAVTTDSQVFSTLTPPTSVPQGGSADIDTAIDEAAALRTSQAYATFDNDLASALADPGLINLRSGRRDGKRPVPWGMTPGPGY